MALDKNKLKQDLTKLFTDAEADESGIDDARANFVNKLADIIDGYVKSVKVTYVNGLTAPNGPVTGTFNNTIS